MGIDVARFVGEFFESFFCPICLEVVENPVMTTNCEHLFCKPCFESVARSGLAQCPTCRQPISKHGSKPLNHVLKSIYGSLKMRCKDPTCDEKINTSNYKIHDETCPKLNFICNSCGYNGKKVIGEEKVQHNCIEFLKGRIKQLESDFAKSFMIREPKRVTCGILFEQGSFAYRCTTCQLRSSMLLCRSCFEKGSHEGHNSMRIQVRDHKSYCDCGDSSCIKYGHVRCAIHTP